jgi:hypothetical protein
MPKQKTGQSCADFCREMNWGVGQQLIGDDEFGSKTIQITAIGERCILAKEVFGTDADALSETSVNLAERSWTALTPELETA